MKAMKRILSATIAAIMVGTMGLTGVLATQQDPVSGVKDDAAGAVTITKYMIVDSTATIPTETFTFKMIPGTAVAGSTTETDGGVIAGSGSTYKNPILAGLMPDNGGTPATEITTQIAFPGTWHVKAGTTSDGIANSTDKKYATGTGAFDMSGISFTKPGVYRYIISEVTPGSPTPGIEYAKNTYTMDVVVGFENATDTGLSILGTYFYANKENNVEIDDTKSKIDMDEVTFPNTLKSKNLTINKTVTGQLGDRTKYFDFSITLGGTNGYKYEFQIQTKDGTEITDTTVLGEVLGASYSGTIAPNDVNKGIPVGTTTIHLKDDQQIVIKGVPEATTYTVEETNYATDGYTQTVLVTGDTTTTATDGRKIESGTDAMKADTTLAYTNNKDTAAPTGVLLNILPFALLVVIAVGGFVVLVRSKRRSH